MKAFVIFSTLFQIVFGAQFLGVIISNTADDERLVQLVDASAQYVSEKLVNSRSLVINSTDQGTIKSSLCEFLTSLPSGDSFQGLIATDDSATTLAAVKQTASEAGIPVIQIERFKWGFGENPSAQPTVTNYIRLERPEMITFAGMDPLLKSIGATDWSKVVILHDEIYAMDATDISALGGTPKSFMRLAVSADVNAQMTNISLLNPDFVILMGSIKNIEQFFNQGNGGATNSIKWIVYTKDMLQLTCTHCPIVEAFWIRPGVNDLFHMALRSYKEFLDKEELSTLFSSVNELEASMLLDSVKFLYNSMSQSPEPSPNYTCGGTTRSTFATDLNIYIAKYQGGYGSYQFAEPNLVFQNVEMIVTKVNFTKENRYLRLLGSWNPIRGIKKIIPDFSADISNLKHVNVVTIFQAPFVEKVIKADGSVVFEGYCIDLIEKIKERLGFTYTLYEAADMTYGTIGVDGQWNGLVRDIIDGEADIALAPLSVMAERENFVDFTVPYYDLVGITILMKKPEPDYSLFKFMTVLEGPVWGCIVGAYFFTSILMWLFDKFSPYSYSNNRDKYKDDPEKREFTLKECLWFCMTSLTPQGGGEAPKNISGRLVAATWWLFGFIIIASYTANLAAFLTVSRLDTPIQSLDDLSHQYKIRYAPVKGTATETYFKRMSEIEARFYDIWKAMSLNESMTPEERAQLAVWDYPVSDKYTNIWRFMQDAGLPNTTESAIEKVLASPSVTEGFAYIGDATEIRYAALTNCKVKQVGSEFSRKPYAIAVQQGSPLKDEISGAILHLLNNRTLESLKEKWWNNNARKQTCPKTSDDSNGISIRNIGGVFIVILIGIVLSIATLVFEYWYYKDKSKVEPGPPNQPVITVSTVHKIDDGGTLKLRGGQAFTHT